MRRLIGTSLSVTRDQGVSRDAFCLLMLVRPEKLDADDLKLCQAAFDRLDEDGSGTLDMADVAAARAKQQALMQPGTLRPDVESATSR